MNRKFRIARTRVPVRMFSNPLTRMDLRPPGTLSTQAFSRMIRAASTVFRLRTVAEAIIRHFPMRAGIPR